MTLPRDRVVLVTGASTGIGRATAEAFIRDGARVAGLARREIRDLDALTMQGDIREPGTMEAMIDRVVRHYGALHVLVNNAGVGLYASVENTLDSELARLFETNVFATVRAIRAALPHLKRSSGQIINITSTFAKSAVPYCAAYCMTKHALHALSVSLRIELDGTGVEVLEIAPGPTESRFKADARVIGMAEPPKLGDVRPWPAEKVARAIVRASREGAREVILGIGGKSLVWAQTLAPSLTDRLLTRKVRYLRGRDQTPPTSSSTNLGPADTSAGR